MRHLAPGQWDPGLTIQALAVPCPFWLHPLLTRSLDCGALHLLSEPIGPSVSAFGGFVRLSDLDSAA
ncbi:hypothetical protein SAMN04487981_13134 [Streptomyces sp. cf386]|nr:hypothetical protein SAMN04487981_13134 [Streptomyces sp. cf386]